MTEEEIRALRPGVALYDRERAVCWVVHGLPYYRTRPPAGWAVVLVRQLGLAQTEVCRLDEHTQADLISVQALIRAAEAE